MALSTHGGHFPLNESLACSSAFLTMERSVRVHSICVTLAIAYYNPPGEFEETISQAYARAANLRGLLLKSECPEALKNCQPMFEKLLKPQVRDTLVTDMLASLPLQDLDDGNDGDDGDADADAGAWEWDERGASPIPQDIFDALQCTLDFPPPRRARFLSHLTIQGLTYTISSKHSGNSQILIKANSAVDAVPCRITSILQFPVLNTIQTYVAVRRYGPSPIKNDPFLHFPMLRAQMRGTELGPLEIHTLDTVHSHFARGGLKWDGKDVNVVLSLSRV
jgi:hypothetical protein